MRVSIKATAKNRLVLWEGLDWQGRALNLMFDSHVFFGEALLLWLEEGLTTSSYIKQYPRVQAIPGDNKELWPVLFSGVFEFLFYFLI